MTVQTDDLSGRSIGRRRSPLDRSWIKWDLIAELAKHVPQQELADKYNCTQASISEFNKRWKTEIESKRSALEDEWHGIWIADQRRRVAQYQQQVEDAEELMSVAMELATAAAKRGVTVVELLDGTEVDGSDGAELARLETEQDKLAQAALANFAKLGKLQQSALRSVAEERGQLPHRAPVVVNTERVQHLFVGVDMDEV